MKTFNRFVPAVLLLFVATSAFAQATRTWVSGVGDDANPCSRTAPCKTFAGAISKTAPGGEIDALDPGGFGALTITKSIIIDGKGGVSSILVAGTNGINIAALATDTVIIRNMSFDGSNGLGTSAIHVSSAAAVFIDHCNMFGFHVRGVDVQTSTAIQVGLHDVQVEDCGNIGVVIGGSVPGVATATLDHVVAEGNVAHGVWITNGNKGTITNSTLSNNGGAGAFIDNVNTFVTIANSTLTNNATGLVAGQTGFGGSLVRISGNVITGNGTGVSITGSSVQTHQNNSISGNSSDIAGGSLVPLGQQ